MKKLYLISALLLAIAATTLFTSCEEITGDAPTNVVLSAATDTSVMITWTAPANAPDKYIVYFKSVGAANYTNVAEVTTTTYTHNPAGATGSYYVAAKFGSNEYDSDAKSTEPIHATAISVSELNATGNSGYGWGRSNGVSGTYSMTQIANTANVDFYISDWAVGFAGSTYYVIDPSIGSTDPGGVVPAGSWHVNGISANSVAEQGPLPAHTTGNYVSSTAIATDPIFLGVWTYDGYFALIKISGVNSGAGTVQIESWFQLVKDLRLIKH
jgi:hypothetical protein